MNTCAFWISTSITCLNGPYTVNMNIKVRVENKEQIFEHKNENFRGCVSILNWSYTEGAIASSLTGVPSTSITLDSCFYKYW